MARIFDANTTNYTTAYTSPPTDYCTFCIILVPYFGLNILCLLNNYGVGLQGWKEWDTRNILNVESVQKHVKQYKSS